METLINPILDNMFYYTSRNTELLAMKVVDPSSYVYSQYSLREKTVNDMARKQGARFFVWFDVSKYKAGRMEEMVKWMRSQKSLWHGIYVTNRPCAIIGGWHSWCGDYLFPSDIKMEELIRRLIKRNRYRFRFHGPDSKWRARQIMDGVRKRWERSHLRGRARARLMDVSVR